MKIAFFGSSLLSAYWNGAATYYRGIIRALHQRGHRVTFYEPDAYDRQAHRDLEPQEWAEVVVYANSEDAALDQVERAASSDLIVKASGIGVFDELLELAVLSLKSERTLVAFWDVDAPATLERLHANSADPFLPLVPRYDAIFTYGGGRPVIDDYLSFGAAACVPIYNGLDPSTHYPVKKERRFAADLSFLGNRLPDREARVDEFFFKAATLCEHSQFVLGGNGWNDKEKPRNVRYEGHVYTADHNALNCSATAVLNISRASMARYGFSPATRVFEAAGAGACLITDNWKGVEEFLEPNDEILIADSGAEVAEILQGLPPIRAAEIGRCAYRRVIADHTYAHRAEEFEEAIQAQTFV
jgi:spore maturation protein CgeB